MDILSFFFSGLLQGVTEWLPVSSSGQSMLALINLFGFDPENAFSFAILLHLGTFFAVVVRMRKDLFEMVARSKDFRNDKLIRFMFVSTLFTGAVGLPVYKLLKGAFSAWHGDLATSFVGGLLVLTGVFIYLSKRSLSEKAVQDLGFFDMVLVGVGQGFSILPGVSRSGTTAGILLMRGVRQDEALRLSFLMSVPAIMGAFVLEAFDGAFSFEPEYAVGFIAAFVSGYLLIDLLLIFSKKLRFDVFCVVFGFIALVFPFLVKAL